MGGFETSLVEKWTNQKSSEQMRSSRGSVKRFLVEFACDSVPYFWRKPYKGTDILDVG